MRNITRTEMLILRLEAMELLRFLKQRHTYAQLTQIFNLPSTVLSRYVLGHVIPTFERARKMYKIALKYIRPEIINLIECNKGKFNITPLIANPLARKTIRLWMFEKVMGHKVDKILTAAVDGIPIATELSSLIGAQLVVAKKRKEEGVKDFWEADRETAGYRETFFIPKSLLRRKDWVVVVDDFIGFGSTLEMLLKFIREARSKPVMALFGVGIGPFWQRAVGNMEIPADVFIELRGEYWQ